MLPVFFLLGLACAAPVSAHDDSAERIARLIYHNECASRSDCLTAWNEGEEFASLGIGHFIWYPRETAAADKGFQESFPALLEYFRQNRVNLPPWLSRIRGCPWPDRPSFLAALGSMRMQELRRLLQNTMAQQAAFMQHRLRAALPDMLSATEVPRHEHIRQQFHRIASSPMGGYVLTDYVNFKGEGTNPGERYNDKGWGLMQVLEGMHGAQPGAIAIGEFADSADRVLTRRVMHAPAHRHEERWLRGWRKRLATYREAARKMLAGQATKLR